MTKLLLAKDVVENRISDLNKKCLELSSRGLTPKMRVILVGNNPASLVYIKNKKKLCQRVGADFELIELPENIQPSEFTKYIEAMNDDPLVTGCFVQLPIPHQLQHLDVTNLINPQKDIDGFHSYSIADIYKGGCDGFVPCTPKGILTLLDHHRIDLNGKNIVVIGRSLIVGKPLSLLLTNKNATVTLCHSKTTDIKELTKRADIIVCAVGIANYLDSSFIGSLKKQIVIDVGINKEADNKICGDVNFSDVVDKVGAITPVPGGVGPLTVLSLIENLLLATERILSTEE